MNDELIKEVLSHLESNNEIISNDFPLIRRFLRHLSSFYYQNFTFRAVFDSFYKGGVRNDMVPIAQAGNNFDDRIGKSREILLCNIFLLIATRLAEKYCVTYSVKERPYEMISLLLFNHYYSFQGKTFCDLGGASSPDIILNLLKSSTHVIIESPDYAEIHGDIFARHAIEGSDYGDKLMSIKCNIEDFDLTCQSPKIDRVFSMNCFEHIMDLGKALSTLYQVCRDNSYIYSTFYPIFSYFDNGDHGSIANKYKKDNPGLHHYSVFEQRAAVKKSFPEYSEPEIMQALASFSFNKIELINKHSLEDFRKIFYSSDFVLLSCQEINIPLFASSSDHRLAYKNLAFKLTSFPEAIGLRCIMKRGDIHLEDSLITNGLIGTNYL